MPNNTTEDKPDMSQFDGFKFAEHKFPDHPLEKLLDEYLTFDGEVYQEAKSVVMMVLSYTSTILESMNSGKISPESLWSGIIMTSATASSIPFYRQCEPEIKSIEGMIAVESLRAMQGNQDSVQRVADLSAAFPAHLIGVANARNYAKAAKFRDDLDKLLMSAMPS